MGYIFFVKSKMSCVCFMFLKSHNKVDSISHSQLLLYTESTVVVALSL